MDYLRYEITKISVGKRFLIFRVGIMNLKLNEYRKYSKNIRKGYVMKRYFLNQLKKHSVCRKLVCIGNESKNETSRRRENEGKKREIYVGETIRNLPKRIKEHKKRLSNA